jgi:type VI protein secretion system component VasK
MDSITPTNLLSRVLSNNWVLGGIILSVVLLAMYLVVWRRRGANRNKSTKESDSYQEEGSHESRPSRREDNGRKKRRKRKRSKERVEVVTERQESEFNPKPMTALVP